jgi:hypothetical protein
MVKRHLIFLVIGIALYGCGIEEVAKETKSSEKIGKELTYQFLFSKCEKLVEQRNIVSDKTTAYCECAVEKLLTIPPVVTDTTEVTQIDVWVALNSCLRKFNYFDNSVGKYEERFESGHLKKTYEIDSIGVIVFTECQYLDSNRLQHVSFNDHNGVIKFSREYSNGTVVDKGLALYVTQYEYRKYSMKEGTFIDCIVCSANIPNSKRELSIVVEGDSIVKNDVIDSNENCILHTIQLGKKGTVHYNFILESTDTLNDNYSRLDTSVLIVKVKESTASESE